MNILTDALPYSVDVGGVEYPINTDFRAGVEFERLMLEGEKDIYKLLALFFVEQPLDVLAAFQAIQKYYACGNEIIQEDTPTHNKQAYSFEIDGKIIFSDFWHFYNIDLSQEGLHWWVFRALLFGLPEKSEFKQRIYYRTCSLKDMSKKERQRVLKIRSQIEIKEKESNKITLQERNDKMKAYLLKRQKETSKEV